MKRHEIHGAEVLLDYVVSDSSSNILNQLRSALCGGSGVSGGAKAVEMILLFFHALVHLLLINLPCLSLQELAYLPLFCYYVVYFI